MANTLNFSNTTPAAPGGQTNVTFQVDASTTPNLSAYVPSQVNADWSAVSGTAQILNKPTIPAAQVSADWNAVSGVSQILNKPTLGTAAAQPTNAFDAAGAATAAVAAIPVFGPSGGSHGVGFVPDPGASAGSTRYLREDATWGTPAGGAVTSVFGRTGVVAAVATDYPAFVASGASHAQGMVPDPGASAGTTKYLREDGTWAVAAQLTGTNTWSNAQTFSQSVVCNLSLTVKMFSPITRTVSTATDTASSNADHTLVLNGVTTETLPATPGNGHEFHIINIGGSAATIAGNGHNIWVNGVSAASISLAPNASIILQYDTTNTIWRSIGDTGGAAAALLSATNSWTGANSFTQAISQTPSASGGVTGYMQPNGTNAASTTLLNPGVLLYNSGGNTFGLDVGYNATSARYRTRLFAPSANDVAISVASASPTAQSAFTDALVVRGDSQNVLIGTPTDNATDKLQVAGSGSFTGVVKVGSAAPALSTSAGVVGSMTWDSGFLYICTALNTWKRVALATF